MHVLSSIQRITSNQNCFILILEIITSWTSNSRSIWSFSLAQSFKLCVFFSPKGICKLDSYFKLDSNGSVTLFRKVFVKCAVHNKIRLPLPQQFIIVCPMIKLFNKSFISSPNWPFKCRLFRVLIVSWVELGVLTYDCQASFK